MPYADPERQKAAKRESARRQRAVPRGTAVEPSPVTWEDLAMTGLILHCGKAGWETEEQYRAALRQHWQRFLAVVEPE
jgi:hypothetical protein